MFVFGELAQLARAPALHAGGQRFESVILHHYTERRKSEGGDLKFSICNSTFRIQNSTVQCIQDLRRTAEEKLRKKEETSVGD